MENYNENHDIEPEIGFETFENIDFEPKILNKYEDLRRSDLSNCDLRNNSIEVMHTVDYSTSTKWPASEYLPVGFDPERYMELGKNPGLGIRELHSMGIDGRGVVVAIIDQKLDNEHIEYADSLMSYDEVEVGEQEGVSFHGPAVASFLVGKNCGTAPGSRLVYKAVGSARGGNFDSESKALMQIIEDNKSCDDINKVKIVSISKGYMESNTSDTIMGWKNAIAKAKESGIIVVDVTFENSRVNFSGGGSYECNDNFDDYNEWLLGSDSMTEQVKDINYALRTMDAEIILKKIKEIQPEHLKKYTEIEVRNMVLEKLKLCNDLESDGPIVIPSDYRTYASSWGGAFNSYEHCGPGGLSWTTPYLAGVFAMALQINPDLKQDDLGKIVNSTAIKNSKGFRVINPKGVIDKVKASVSGNK